MLPGMIRSRWLPLSPVILETNKHSHVKSVISAIFLFLPFAAYVQSFTSIPGPLGSVHCLLAEENGFVLAGTHTKGVFVYDPVLHNWKGVGGNTIKSGRVNALIRDGMGVLTAGTEQGGIKQWDGIAWSDINSGLPGGCSLIAPVRALLSTPNEGLLAGLHSQWPCISAGGVYRFDGMQWTPLNHGLSTLDLLVLTTETFSQTVLCGTNGGGIWRLKDTTWSAWNDGLDDLSIYSITNTPDGRVFVGTGSGLYTREPGALEWTYTGIGLPSAPVLAIAIDPSNPQKMIVGTGYPSDQPGDLRGQLFISSDQGNTWTEVASSVQTTAIRQIAYTSPDTLHVATWGFLQSTDQGSTWTQNNTGYSGRAFSTSGCLAVLDSPSVSLFYGTDEGVFRTTDNGLTWQFASQGLDRSQVTLLESDREGNLFCGTMRYLGYPSGGYGDGRLMRSTDQGLTWSPVQISTDWRYLDMDEAPNGDLYCAHGFGAQAPSATIIGSSLAVSHDHGLTWTDLPVMSGMAFCTTTTPAGDLFVAGESAGTWRSTDQGATWTLLPIANQNSNLTVLETSDQGDLILSGGATRGLFFSSAQENGVPWNTYDNPLFPDYNAISDALFDQSGNVWCTTRGQNGTPALFFLPAPLQANTAFQPVTGIFGPLFHMAWDACGYLYIYSPGSVLKSDDPLRDPVEPCLPTAFTPPTSTEHSLTLYPNPASDMVWIKVHSPAGTGWVRVTNYLGEEIQCHQIVLENGENTFPLSTGVLPSGLYQVIVSTPGFFQSVSLVIQPH